MILRMEIPTEQTRWHRSWLSLRGRSFPATPNDQSESTRRGYSDDDIRKILGENALRVLSAAERVSQELRVAGKPTPPLARDLR